MNGTAFVILSGTLTFGIPLLLAIRELFELKRRGRGSWDGDGPGPALPPKPPSFGHKPLPDCLIPRLLPRSPVDSVRVREIERV